MRRNDWEKQLVETIARHDEPFKYGRNDCCTFALDIVYAVTGEHVLHDYHYTDRITALRILKRSGGVVGIVDEILKRTSNPMRGDVVADNHEGKVCLGVCLGTSSAFVAEKGIAYMPLSHKAIAWRVN